MFDFILANVLNVIVFGIKSYLIFCFAKYLIDYYFKKRG